MIFTENGFFRIGAALVIAPALFHAIRPPGFGLYDTRLFWPEVTSKKSNRQGRSANTLAVRSLSL
jgi:hypothetical protein